MSGRVQRYVMGVVWGEVAGALPQCRGCAEGGVDEVPALRKNVGELEVSLQCELTFMDVVNELKVIKMTLALANMENEQAGWFIGK